MNSFPLAFPFVLTAFFYLILPVYSEYIKRRIVEASDSSRGVRSVDLVLRRLDWATDVPQVAFVVLLPLVGLLFTLPESFNLLPIALGGSALTLLLVVALAIAIPPDRYARWSIGRYSLATIMGITTNLVTFGLILLLVPSLQSGVDHPLAAARDLLKIQSVKSVDTKDPTVYTVEVSVLGGPQALGNRTLWIANNTFQEGEDIYKSPVYFPPTPCVYSTGQNWKCDSVYIGPPVDPTHTFAIYAFLANDRALAEIISDIKNQNQKGNGSKAPAGTDSLPAFKFDRPA